MTLTTEQLKYGAEVGDLGIDAVRAVCAEALANREAQPAGFYTTVSGRKGVVWHNGAPEDDTAIYTAPPAPAVPGIDELRLAFERAERESDDGFNLHKYGIGYADEATQSRWESWLACRAAMLAQPVSSGYKLNSPEIPDGWKLVPIDATRAMIDAAQRVEEDGYDAMHKAMLAAAPEGGNDHDAGR